MSARDVRTKGLAARFVMCELDAMQSKLTIAELRKEKDLTLEAFAASLGLKSKGQAKEIENGQRCSVRVALEIEKLSGGRIPASSLNPDVGLVEDARGLAA
jgi:hypothetical protein